MDKLKGRILRYVPSLIILRTVEIFKDKRHHDIPRVYIILIAFKTLSRYGTKIIIYYYILEGT